ncbi:MAG: hypothetical protein H6R05_565 [Burkholderiaceae bacterium]|nr:hypothetical protein [Burkholderiaceae bacterium]
MAKKFPLNPAHPERICWGCERYCPVEDIACGNGSDRTQHPIEIFGEGWEQWLLDDENKADKEHTGLADKKPDK